jgi:catechol 2,3-dioxygenase-like lactoylglutathione lyase family enzyme
VNQNQITIPATDLARSAAFYERLGLVRIVDSIPLYARFECPDGGATLSLHHVDRVDPESGFTIYFECHDLDGEVARLESQGVRFESGPLDRPWLWREAIVRDPDGTRVCLYHAGENRRFPPWRVGRPAS